ncbi:hypothetical protein FACS1894199_02870 [Bacteroidia bacterium]|nr:hypothetical protein FACS1894199_02870 [Bacteroidia bacterium]
MKKTKHKTREELAAEIGADYYGLKLLDYLWGYFPEEAEDIDFIRRQAADAAAEEEKYLLEHGTDPMEQLEARRKASASLLGGFGYSLSKYEMLFPIVDEYLYDHKIDETMTTAREETLELIPKCASIFNKYAEKYEFDESFRAEPDYDTFEAELTKRVTKLLEKAYELPF